MRRLAFLGRLPYWSRLVMALVVVVAPVFVLCIIVARDSYQSAENMAGTQARSAVTLVDVYLRVYLDKYFGILKTLAVEQSQRNNGAGVGLQSMQSLLEHVALDHPRVSVLAVLDGQGKIVASSRPQALGLDCGNTPWWQRLIESQVPVVSDFEDSAALGGPVVVLAVPVPGSTNAVALTLNTSTMSTVYEGLYPAGAVMLADRTGVPIVESNRPELPTSERQALAKNSSVLAMVRQAAGTIILEDVRDPATGETVIGAGLVDPDYGWSVTATQSYDAVLGPTRQSLLRTWITLGVALLLSFAIAVLLIGRGRVRRVVLPEIADTDGSDGLETVFRHLRQQAESGLYGEVNLRFRGGRVYKATVSRERIFD